MNTKDFEVELKYYFTNNSTAKTAAKFSAFNTLLKEVNKKNLSKEELQPIIDNAESIADIFAGIGYTDFLNDSLKK